MPEYSDWHAYLAKQEQKKRAEAERAKLAAAPVVKDNAYKARQVLDHPAWQWFAQAIDDRVTHVERTRAMQTNEMIYGSCLGQDLERLKITLNVMDAEIAGLQYALSLCPKAVEMGNDITGEFPRSVAGTSADR